MSDILTPLPEKLRPTSFENILGQKKILSNDGILSRIIKKKILTSFILWGPPGCGKTTIAKAISNELNIETFEISAVLSGVKDLRSIFEKGEKNFLNGISLYPNNTERITVPHIPRFSNILHA